MNDRAFKQSDFMAAQLMEIENFRKVIAEQNREKITFREAIMLWIAEGYADEFKAEYLLNQREFEPALA